MNVALWAEIRRLAEIEKLSRRAISRRLHCARHTVDKALNLNQPPAQGVVRRTGILDIHRSKIDALLAKYPDLSAVRICEEIARGADGYTGSACTLRRYLRTIRPTPGRVYQEVDYSPAQAMQVDWGTCGCVRVGDSTRKVSVFVAVLCYSRLTFIEFTLSQRKAEFYRGIVNALNFFGGCPRAIIFDNLKAGVINGSGRAACFHSEFLALCGYFYLQPIACQRRDPESKGIVEGTVRYIKGNALAGRADELVRFEDYLAFAPRWRDQTANVRIHETTRERPVDRFQQERSLLRALPTIPFDTDEVVPAVVTPHARINFDGNRYSVPPRLVRRPVTVRATRDEVRVLVDMINQLTTAQINGLLGNTLKSHVSPSLLLLDELDYLPVDKRGADLLFQVVAARYEVGSIVLTTNRSFKEWGTLFDVDNTLATALIDRLMHHGEAIVIQGPSYRMKDKDSDSTSE